MEIIFDKVTYKENISTTLEKTFLKNASFKLEGNKVYAILGDSKSGINKIPNLINATAKPLMGKVKIGEFLNDGKYIKNVNKLRMNIGIVPSNPSDMLFNNTVKEELNFGLKYFKYKLNKQEIRIMEALKLVGLTEDYLNKRISSLTISEKKKISIASALIFNPSVIIFEEPTNYLKYREIEELKRLIKLLKNKYNKMIIIISKNTDFAYEVSDEVYIINKGTVSKYGNAKLLTEEEILNENNLEAPNIVKFINTSNKMGGNLTYTNNILDLIKEVYRNVH